MRLCLYLVLSLNILYANNILKYKTFKADFTQSVTNDTNTTITYTGKIFAKHDQMLWVYKTPIPKYIYLKKSYILILEPELEQVIITSLSKEHIDLFQLLKDGKKIATNKYEVKSGETKYLITFKNNILWTISYKNIALNNILITFVNSKKDIKLNNQIFSYEIPKDYDVIRR